MTTSAIALGRQDRQDAGALRPIGIAGLVSGGLDLTAAFILYGVRVPRTIAGGLLGPSARHGGAGTWVLGVVLQFFIATGASAVFYFASRKLRFMLEHWLVCGMFFGIAAYLVMNLIVVPLSALHARGPFSFSALWTGLLVHMFLIGVPIAFLVRRFSH